MAKNYKRVKFGCYFTNLTMSVIANISPVLFLSFRSLYGISFSLLGLLVVINFSTQLMIDLVFSFFSHKFNIAKTVKLTPVFAVVGLITYALLPFLFPQYAYAGIVIGTIIFSLASGLAEVLISPVIAAIPSENPDREMSKLHSVYAWGCVGVIIFCTLFIKIFSSSSWQIMALILSLIPLTSAILFFGTDIPEMEASERSSGILKSFKSKALWGCIIAIFLGGASECTMAQWCSGYAEQALNIPKVYGDIFGAAMFGMMLGLGRTLYAKIGKGIDKVLLICTLGAAACYLTAAVSDLPVIGLVACALTGLCTSMLWPGNLIAATDRLPGSVFLFAIMAAGGDLGASIGPQLVGVITDMVISNPSAVDFAQSAGLTVEQLGMKAGILVAALFPIAAIPLYICRLRNKSKLHNPA